MTSTLFAILLITSGVAFLTYSAATLLQALRASARLARDSADVHTSDREQELIETGETRRWEGVVLSREQAHDRRNAA